MTAPADHRPRRRLLVAAAASSGLLSARLHAQAGSVRVITVGGALTEIVYRLGAESVLVATDTTSFYPAAALALPKVGYQRSLSAEGVLSLRPTVLLATADAGPPAALAQLQSAGVRIVRMETEHSFAWLRRTVQRVATEIGRAEAGTRLNDELAVQWQSAQAAIAAKAGARPRVLFVLSHSGPVQVAGAKTAAQAMIELAGAVNALSGFDGYRPLSAEAVIAAAPHFILTTRQSIEALGGVDGVLSRPGLALTPAGKTQRVLAPDALLLLGFGPRLPQAVLELARALGTAA